MDTVNHFFTKTTALNARAEYGLGFIVSMWLMLAHWSELNFWLAFGLFAYIDLFGTVPGLVAYHFSPNGQIHRAYYIVYDVLHSAFTQGLVVIALVQVFGYNWAFLGIAAHIFVDRAMFNNYPKPFGVAFDPVPHPAFQRFIREYAEFNAAAADWKAIKRGETSAEAAPVTTAA